MTCFICQRDYARLKRHLRIQHTFENEYIEPFTIKQFSWFLLSLPTSKTILSNKKTIKEFVEGICDLPKELYSEIESQLLRYKKMSGFKPTLRIAKSKMKRSNTKKRKNASNENNQIKVKGSKTIQRKVVDEDNQIDNVPDVSKVVIDNMLS